MTDTVSAFATLIGRQPTDQEVQRLYRIKSTLNIRDNDALFLVLAAFESYDTLFKQYPALVGAEVERTIERVREQSHGIAQAEVSKALASLTDAVITASRDLSTEAMIASRYMAWGWALIGAVLFGAVCIFVGVVLGSGHLPYWAKAGGQAGPMQMILVSLATAPVGWVVVLWGFAMVGMATWRARRSILAGQQRLLLVSAFALMALSAVLLVPVLLNS
ncbi:hypothetical protein [Achromobacter insuavis]|uniref:hypothetical protein n=1 Tax=Achromobacter insuavis TaxID=1287735 RepID=UPI001F1295E2|nr:hypothetical protein [Achromobacter insuavis]